jgi:hypothetical protein
MGKDITPIERTYARALIAGMGYLPSGVSETSINETALLLRSYRMLNPKSIAALAILDRIADLASGKIAPEGGAA